VAAMDVQIEQQIQLLSRIQLAIDSQNGLCFLHGVSGVGKSHLINLLVEKSTNTCCIKLNNRTKIDADKFKQQLICELATDDFSDLEQPLVEAVAQRVDSLQQSIVIIVDNAADLPQNIIAMLWHCVNDFNRMKNCGHHFSVVLVGESTWAMPFFKALDKKENSLVAEFLLKPLNKQQATDFMMAVHSSWSDRKIEQFVDKLTPEYRLPKQLIYGQSESVDSGLNKRLVILLLGVSLVALLGLVSIYFLNQQSFEKSIAPVALPSDSTSFQVNVEDEVTPIVSETPGAEQQPVSQVKITPENPPKKEPSIGVVQSSAIKAVAPVRNDLSEPEEDLLQTPQNIKIIKPSESSEELKPVVLDIAERNDDEALLDVDPSHYSLMLGGYSNINIFTQMRDSLATVGGIYHYKTIRNDKLWFVLLYGNFETRAAANEALQALPNTLSSFTPWPKPFTTIHQEIAAFASTLTDNN